MYCVTSTSIEYISTVFHIGEQIMYTIGEVSKITGISPGGIRYYEMTGTIKPNREYGLRVYTKQDVKKIKQRRQQTLSQRKRKK